MSYYATSLLPDGTPDDVHYCFSLHEAHAAAAAVRVANRLECDTCVVDDATGKITQVIHYRPDVPYLTGGKTKEKAPDTHVERHYLSQVDFSDPIVQAAMLQHLAQGFMLTLTPVRDMIHHDVRIGIVNIVASRHKR